MSKKFFQDILSTQAITRHLKVKDLGDEFDNDYSSKKRAWTPLLFIVIGSLVILGIFFVLSSTFSRVTVKVKTTIRDIDVASLIFLNKDGSGGGLKYDLMRFTKTESASIPITGSKTVQKVATGKVTIYNSYSSATQKLVAGTRLETKDGKIYKINKAVTVPGIKSSGGKIAPGSIEVMVTASQVGPSYNISPSDFTIPGFQGNAKYQKITARSSTNIAGGFSGTIKIANPADIQKARLRIEESLKQELTKNALMQVPAGMILYTDALLINFTNNIIGDSALPNAIGSQANLKVTSSLNAIIINRDDLKKLILKTKLPEMGDVELTIIPNLDKINFMMINKDKVNLNSMESIMVKIGGQLNVVWDFDQDDLKNKLIGVKRANYQEVLKTFPMVEKAEATLSPSWAFYFPSDPSRIEIDKGF